jgi:3-phosphoshikimate 1-carboxyvinyltransferase
MPVASAQVKTCLLLAALVADSPSTLREPEVSRDHSERMLSGMGVDVRVEDTRVTLTPLAGAHLKPLHLVLPGDISSAAFLIVAGLISPRSEITLRDVLLNPTRTGLLDALSGMGASIKIEPKGERGGEPVGDLTIYHSSLTGTEIDGSLAVRMIDEFPAFAIAAAFATGQTVVRGAEELRHKESDRIAALCGELRILGVGVEDASDGFCIQGGIPDGGVVRPSGDHRLAMALAVAGLAAHRPVTIQDAEIIADSFPGFVHAFQSLGASMSIKL